MPKAAVPCVAAGPTLNMNMHSWIDHRRSAILLHLTALPGPFHKGVIGEEARQFIDAMVSGGFSVWQFLPLGPSHGHGSPYESLSTFAGNPELIDLRECVYFGWLDHLPEQLSAEDHYQNRQMASQRFWSEREHNPALREEIDAFTQQHHYWLHDFALFSALKKVTHDRAWWQWHQPLRDRHPEALQQAQTEHHDLIRQVIFEQFLFNRQWHALKNYAESRDVRLFGDLPIYVAHDSADVWCNRDYFTLNGQGLCDEVAGVPPDYFSETGQRWGNPLYRWDKLQESGFEWWLSRIQRQLELMHMLRIDHFLALEAYWAIPGESEDGIIGEWRKAPGRELLQTLQNRLGTLPLIAEDLGIITAEVTALRHDFDLPGMKVLQFAFSGDEKNPYLPANHEENSVVYTGTHDNNTTMGWFNDLDEQTRIHMFRTLGGTPDSLPWNVIESALASSALLSVIPMQDILALGGEARFNTPGTLDGPLHSNWSWRLAFIPAAHSSCWQQADRLNRKYQR